MEVTPRTAHAREWLARGFAAVGLFSTALERSLSPVLDPSLSGGFLALAAVAFFGALLMWLVEDEVPWRARIGDITCTVLVLAALVLRWVADPDLLSSLPGSWLVFVASLPLVVGSALRNEFGSGTEQAVGTAKGTVALGGVLMLLAALLDASLAYGFGPFTRGALVLGAGLLLEYAALDRQRVGGTVASRPFQFGTGSVILVLLAALLSLGLYVLARNNDHTWDLTKKQAFTMSDQARRVAEGIGFDVKITAFFRASTPGRDEFQHLVDRFHEANPRIAIEYVDPLQEPRRAEEALVTGDHGTIVLEGNGRDRRLEWEVTENELVRALVLLSSTEEHTVCWSLGHGEPDPDDEFTDDGLGAVRLELEGLNYKVRKLEIAKTGIERDCGILVVVRPTVEWFPYEREALAAYVAEGGRVLLLLDSGDVPDFADELERFGVLAGDDVVIDLNRKNQMLGVDDPSFVVLSAENFGEHPITRNLAAALVMPIARSMRAVPEPPAGIEVLDLLRTSPEAWGETDPGGAVVQPDEGVEVVGEVPVMAVVSVTDPGALEVTLPGTTPPADTVVPLEGAPDPTDLARGVPADFTPKAGGRMVIIGDSDFAANRFLVWGNNRDLFLNSVAWLAEEEDQIGERPTEGETLEVSLAAQGLWCVFSVVLVPMLAAAGAVVTLLRRRYL